MELYFSEFMKLLAVPMRQLHPYTAEHLFVVICCVFVAVITVRVCLSAKIKKDRVLFTCGLVLLFSEILKQPLLTFVSGGYNWTGFPFQLCSIPMYLCLFYPFCGWQSRKREYISSDTAPSVHASCRHSAPSVFRVAVESFFMTFGLLGAVFAFAVPDSSFRPWLLLTVQSLLWHTVLLFLALYLWSFRIDPGPVLSRIGDDSSSCLCKMSADAFRNNRFSRLCREFLPAAALYLIAACFAVILNAAFFRLSGGTCNMFFLGPGFPNVDILLNSLSEEHGWIAETAAMITGTICLAAAVWILGNLLSRLAGILSASVSGHRK